MVKRKRKPEPLIAPQDEYVVVNTREGTYKRRKRGSVKKAVVNKVLQKNVSNGKIAGSVGTSLFAILEPFLSKMILGRINLRIRNTLVQTLNRKSKMDFSLFEGFELQKDYPLNKVLVNYKIIKKSDEILVTIPINQYTIRSKSTLVTEYYFELILLHGDPSKPKSFRIDTTDSYRYPFIKNPKESVCTLSIILPSTKAPWMVFLKLNCREGKEAAAHAKHYPMKVVAVG